MARALKPPLIVIHKQRSKMKVLALEDGAVYLEQRAQQRSDRFVVYHRFFPISIVSALPSFEKNFLDQCGPRESRNDSWALPTNSHEQTWKKRIESQQKGSSKKPLLLEMSMKQNRDSWTRLGKVRRPKKKVSMDDNGKAHNSKSLTQHLSFLCAWANRWMGEKWTDL